MVEYLRSVWHADLNFYSRALSSTALRVGCSLKCLPGYPTFLCQAMWLCWSFFSSLKPVWGVECWRGFDLQVLCCGTLSAFVCLSQTVLQWWHLVMTSSQASHNMKSWQKYDRNYALVLALFFFSNVNFWPPLFHCCRISWAWPLLSAVVMQIFLLRYISSRAFRNIPFL